MAKRVILIPKEEKSYLRYYGFMENGIIRITACGLGYWTNRQYYDIIPPVVITKGEAEKNFKIEVTEWD